MKYDLVVVGLGGMGSATVAHASDRGYRVLGVDQFARGHDFGASSGRTRIIRKAYFEAAEYVPLLTRAYELWRQLQERTNYPLLNLSGLLIVGRENGSIIQRTLNAAIQHQLPLERLEAADLVRRFPGTNILPHEYGLYEREAGMVFPERAVQAHLHVAENNGAELRFGARVTAYHANEKEIRVNFTDGTAVRTGKLAVCAGPWTSQILQQLHLPLHVQRNVQIWFHPSTPAFRIGHFPTFLIERETWPARLYGMPDLGDGLKAAFHGFGEQTDATHLDRSIRTEDIVSVRQALEDFLPGAAARFASGKACMYTLTPDENFIVDRHPEDERIVVAAGFSGHGFKFAPVIGEVVADLAFDGQARHSISFLRLNRFQAVR
jgi:sarcosine oxidase